MSSALAAPQSYTNACRNNAVPTNWDQVDVTTSGTSPAGPVAPGDPVSLTGLGLQMAIPGAIFVAGYNLGLLTTGVNNIPGHISEVIDGTNTVEGSQTTNSVDSVLSTTITDVDGTPGTGDESATDAAATVAFNDLAWTAGAAGLPINFAEHNDPAETGATGGGIAAIADLAGGALHVQFHCTGGSVTGSNPGTATFANAPAFATTPTVNHTPTCTSKTVSVKHATKLTISLPCTDSDTGQTLTRSIVTPPAHGSLGAISSTGNVSYTPKSTYGGTDSFTFHATDGNGGTSNTATVTLKIAAGKTGLTLSASATKVKTGSKVRLKGRLQDLTTKKYLNAQRIYLQRRSGTSGSWTTVTSKLTATVSGKRGVVVFSVTVKHSFYYHLRYKGSAAYKASTSRAVHVVAT